MSEVVLVIVIALVFLCGFPLLWIGIVYLLSRLGGWPALARHYSFHGTFSGTMFNIQSATTGPLGNYRNCMTFGVNGDGLYMSPLVFFRPGHPPLLFPWDDIEVSESRGFSLIKMVALSPRKAPNRTIMISKGLARKIDRGVFKLS